MLKRSKGRGEKAILKELTEKIEKANRKRNLILVVMIAVAVAALLALLTLARGRLLAEQLREVREEGTAANVVLNDGNREQYEQILELDYVDNVGMEKKFGICYLNQRRLCDCSIMTGEDFFHMYAPAYDNLTGSFPKDAEEVILSTAVLNSMGITEPEIGMEIWMKIVRNDWMTSHAGDIEDTFRLSGYYTDYSGKTEELPKAYFSMEFFKVKFAEENILANESMSGHSKQFFPADILLKWDDTWLTDDWLEKQLYRDIRVDSEQRFYIRNTGIAEYMKNLFGGYIIAVTGIVLLLSGLYLFIYNILSISNARDRKQYGLLKVVGMSPRQLKKLFLIQSIRLIAVGMVIGAAVGSLMVTFVFPGLMEKMYLAGAGSMADEGLFSGKLLLISMIFTGIVVWIAFYRSVHSLMNLSPVVCLHNSNISSEKIRAQAGCKRNILNFNTLLDMAWRNVNRDKGKMWITLSSLFLGVMMVLLSVCIINGIDRTNKIAQNPDFTISITKDAVENYFYQNAGRELEEVQGHELLPEKMISDVLEIAEVQRENIVECIGVYGTAGAEYRFMIPGTEQEIRDRVTELTIQVVSDEWLEQLADYVKKEKLEIDLSGFMEENGFLFLHENAFTREQGEQAETYRGKKFPVFLMENGGRGCELTCSGYLDITEEDFPEFSMPWNGKNLNYMIVSEKTFEDMNCTPQVYQISFDVEKDRETEIKRALQILMVNANQSAEISNTYEMTANSDLLSAEESYILATRLVMGVFSTILIFLAVINYGNTVVTGVVSREAEFTTMRSISMTKRQLKKMLILEGNCYCIYTLGLVLSIGNVILWIIKKIMEEKVSYFTFEYPIVALVIIFIIWSVCNVLLIKYLFRTFLIRENVNE